GRLAPRGRAPVRAARTALDDRGRTDRAPARVAPALPSGLRRGARLDTHGPTRALHRALPRRPGALTGAEGPADPDDPADRYLADHAPHQDRRHHRPRL